MENDGKTMENDGKMMVNDGKTMENDGKMMGKPISDMCDMAMKFRASGVKHVP